VEANGREQRVGTITVNGQAFTVTQAPNQSTCGYSLNTTGVSVSEQASSSSFTLTTGAGCAWTATSNATNWLSVTPQSGAGSDTINYSVIANSGQQRVGVITVGGQNFTVTQDPNPANCTFVLSPSSKLSGVGGDSDSFNVTTGAGCHWDAATTDGWIYDHRRSHRRRQWDGELCRASQQRRSAHRLHLGSWAGLHHYTMWL
jgi:hypothetical protein